MRITVEELADMLTSVEVLGNREIVIENAASIEKAGPGDITFARDEANLKKLHSQPASAVIIENSLVESLSKQNLPATFIVVDDALSAFTQVLEHFHPRRALASVGISPKACIDPSAQIGANTNIYPGAQISADVIIGNKCSILPGVYVGPGCRIGNDVSLHPNVVLYDGVILGNRVVIHASSVIGSDGFGYRQVDGRHERTPHFGTVRIEDDVEIGACTTIDRAVIGETIIGEGTKIDNLVQIAHNCEIGSRNLFAALVAIGGSVTTGKYVVCAGQVGVVDHVHLGDGAMFGARTGVHKSLPGGQTYLGSPAGPENETIRNFMAYRKLYEQRQKVIQLEKQVSELTEKMEKCFGKEGPTNYAA